MAECPETDVALVYNSDIVKKVRALKKDLRNCNADKAALRSWSTGMKEIK